VAENILLSGYIKAPFAILKGGNEIPWSSRTDGGTSCKNPQTCLNASPPTVHGAHSFTTSSQHLDCHFMPHSWSKLIAPFTRRAFYEFIRVIDDSYHLGVGGNVRF
jgi:hypothetical protein